MKASIHHHGSFKYQMLDEFTLRWPEAMLWLQCFIIIKTCFFSLSWINLHEQWVIRKVASNWRVQAHSGRTLADCAFLGETQLCNMFWASVWRIVSGGKGFKWIEGIQASVVTSVESGSLCGLTEHSHVSTMFPSPAMALLSSKSSAGVWNACQKYKEKHCVHSACHSNAPKNPWWVNCVPADEIFCPPSCDI